MSELTVSSWHRKGRHRLYVNRSDGTNIGYWDLVANEPRPNHPGDHDDLVRYVRQWTAGHADEAAWWMTREQVAGRGWPQSSGDAGNGGRRARGESWTHLAAYPAGAGERAGDERAESPVRALWERVRRTDKGERHWRIGADVEEKVGALLERVAREDLRWRAPIRSVPVGRASSDIDHVFIGSGGVFTINVRHHPRGDVAADGDTIRVNGHDWHYLEKSRHEAARVSRLLSAACGFTVHVEAIVVIVGARHLSVGRPSDGVHVLEASYLTRWLRARCDIHSERVVQTVHNVAQRSTAWRPSAAS